jgi:Aerobic-type carbon monoxide dehydrogenase, middle subunit CoxM/CutM homologs
MSFPDLVIPETVDQAVEALSFPHRQALIFGGGTLVQPFITLGDDAHDLVVDLDHLALNQVVFENGQVSCGSMVRLAQLAQALPQDYIQAAVASIAGPAIRNLATVGGNLFAKPPYGDLATLLLALDAELELASSEGTRRISLNDFYLLRDNAEASATGVLVTCVRFAADSRRTVVFRKMARKQLNAGAVVTVALSLRLDGGVVGDARLALGGVDRRPIRAPSAERVLTGSNLSKEVIESAAQAALQDCHPQTDAYASSWYRQRMVPLQIRRALTGIASSPRTPTS